MLREDEDDRRKVPGIAQRIVEARLERPGSRGQRRGYEQAGRALNRIVGVDFISGDLVGGVLDDDIIRLGEFDGIVRRAERAAPSASTRAATAPASAASASGPVAGRNRSGSASGFSGSFSPTMAFSSSTRGSSFRSLSPKYDRNSPGRAVEQRPADHLRAPANRDQLALQQGVQHAAGIDAADRVDLGLRDRLLVRDDRERFQGRAATAASSSCRAGTVRGTARTPRASGTASRRRSRPGARPRPPSRNRQRARATQGDNLFQIDLGGVRQATSGNGDSAAKSSASSTGFS
jgi:hypothetical protein